MYILRGNDKEMHERWGIEDYLEMNVITAFILVNLQPVVGSVRP